MPLNNPGDALVGEGHIEINPRHYSAIIAGTFAESGNINWPYNTFTNSSGAINDALEYLAYLATGTYTLQCTHITDTDQGIVTFYLDGVSLGTKEFYAAAPATAYDRITAISVATSGIKTLKLKTESKNGASSAYKFGVKTLGFWRTA